MGTKLHNALGLINYEAMPTMVINESQWFPSQLQKRFPVFRLLSVQLFTMVRMCITAIFLTIAALQLYQGHV